jgi:hypothetical protein
VSREVLCGQGRVWARYVLEYSTSSCTPPYQTPTPHLRDTGIGQLTSSQPTTGPRNSVRRRRCAGRSATEMGRKEESTYRRERVTYHSLVTVAWESESTSTSNESLGWDLEYRRAGRKETQRNDPKLTPAAGPTHARVGCLSQTHGFGPSL